jgi:hypothetical protein
MLPFRQCRVTLRSAIRKEIRVISRRTLVALACLVSAPILAQEKPVAPPVAVVAPALTADEQKDHDILGLKAQLTTALKTISELQAALGACYGQLGPYQQQQNGQALEQETKALKERVEQRTGYAWDPDTGKFGAKKPVDSKKSGG